ncbi:unnamed protein product [Malus baccata var. baccata]
MVKFKLYSLLQDLGFVCICWLYFLHCLPSLEASSIFATKDVIRLSNQDLGKFLSLPKRRIPNICNGAIDEVLGRGFQDIVVGESTPVGAGLWSQRRSNHYSRL